MSTFIDIDPSFRRDPRTGDVMVAVDNMAVRNSIVGLVQTAFGSRPFEPQFDSPVDNLLFKPNNIQSMSPYMIENVIGQLIVNHEPRANFLGSTVSYDKPNEVVINITYQLVEDPEQERNLEITI